MLPEFFIHLVNLDLDWFIFLVSNNIFWLFAFFAAAFILSGGKSFSESLSWFIAGVFYVWVSVDSTKLFGWVLLGAAFLGLHYITRMSVVMFGESVSALKPRFTLLLLIQFSIVYTAYNVYILNFT